MIGLDGLTIEINLRLDIPARALELKSTQNAVIDRAYRTRSDYDEFFPHPAGARDYKPSLNFKQVNEVRHGRRGLGPCVFSKLPIQLTI